VCTLLEKGVCTVELGETELETLRTCARELRARHWRARAARAKKTHQPSNDIFLILCKKNKNSIRIGSYVRAAHAQFTQRSRVDRGTKFSITISYYSSVQLYSAVFLQINIFKNQNLMPGSVFDRTLLLSWQIWLLGQSPYKLIKLEIFQMSITSSKISFGTQFKAHIVENRATRPLRLKQLEKELGNGIIYYCEYCGLDREL
jgi:hypothetical protein